MKGSKRIARIQARQKASTTAKASTAAKALAYVRVSTDEQAATGHGLDTQERAIRAFAESQGYDLVDLIVDAGVSGATRPADRPGFARVYDLAADKAFSILLVHKFDRLARDIRFAVSTVADLFEQHEVAIKSVTEAVIDTATPMGRTLFAILAGMAESERFAIRDRTAGGRVVKATKGGYACGGVPYGYERGPDGELKIVAAQARIVRRIYEARKRKRTLQSIADELNSEGIPSPKGAKWHPPRVAYVLDNPRYRGAVEYLFSWSGSETHVLREGAHEAIV